MLAMTELPGAPSFTESASITNARKLAAGLARSDLPILITGEVGTGKRTLAHSLANLRIRSGLPVIEASALDGFPKQLRESGSGGCVLVLHHLQALGEKEQLGLASILRARQVLLIATSKASSSALAPDLSALIDATEIRVPPLRERDGDMNNWAELFNAKAAAALGTSVRAFSVEARRAIAMHPWPGNLSELESVITRAVLLSESTTLEPEDLGFREKLVVQPLNEAIEEFRTAYVSKVLTHFDGNRSQAARALGVDPRTIFRHLAKTKGEDTEP